MPKYELFLDGSCYVCSWDARWIRKRDKNGIFLFKNISEPLALDAGTPPFAELNRKLHVREISTGSWHTGIDSIILILNELPEFQWMGKILKFPIIYLFAKPAYLGFAWIRMYLPKRKNCSLKK